MAIIILVVSNTRTFFRVYYWWFRDRNDGEKRTKLTFSPFSMEAVGPRSSFVQARTIPHTYLLCVRDFPLFLIPWIGKQEVQPICGGPVCSIGYCSASVRPPSMKNPYDDTARTRVRRSQSGCAKGWKVVLVLHVLWQRYIVACVYIYIYIAYDSKSSETAKCVWLAPPGQLTGRSRSDRVPPEAQESSQHRATVITNCASKSN